MVPKLDDGWHVNATALSENFESSLSGKALEAAMCNADIRDFGDPIIVNLLTEGKVSKPIVLQVNSWRNVSGPKSSFHSAKDDLQHGGLVRYFLTDGHSTISGVSADDFSRIGLQMGCKVRLDASCQIESGFLMLSKRCMAVLGGSVERLRIKNEKERSVYLGFETQRRPVDPKATSTTPAVGITEVSSGMNEESLAAFEEQRKKNITEASASRVKTQFVAPTTVQPPPKTEYERPPRPERTERPANNRGHDRKGRRGKEEDEVPAEFSRPSAPSTLFDFLVPGGSAAIAQPTVTAAPPAKNYSIETGNRGAADRGNRRPFESKGPGANKGYGNDNRGGEKRGFERKQPGRNDDGGRPDGRGPVKDRSFAPSQPGASGADIRRGNDRRPQEKNNDPRRQNQRGQGRDTAPQNFSTGPGNESRQRNDRRSPQERNNDRIHSAGGRQNGRGPARDNGGPPRRNQNFHGGNQNFSPRAPSPTFWESDFPAVAPLTQGLSQLSVDPSSSSAPPSGRASSWRVNNKCFAPWHDGQIYFATIMKVGPGNKCTVLFDDYGNEASVEQDLLLTVGDATRLFSS